MNKYKKYKAKHKDMINVLNESITTNLNENSYIKLTYESKKQAAINRAILDLAKEANDPLYRKYRGTKKKMLMFRERMRMKYETRARIRVAENRAK